MLQILTTSIFDSTKIIIYLSPNKAGLFEGSFFWGRVSLTPFLPLTAPVSYLNKD